MYILTVLNITVGGQPKELISLFPDLQNAYVEEVYPDLETEEEVIKMVERHISVYLGGTYQRVEDGDNRLILVGKTNNYVFQWFYKKKKGN